ncbi:MAG TPA: cation:proton antiporter [Gemmatimonadaceae bacterium]|jgi:CPA1 family monovalent cation:H+ antiporter
MQTIVILLVVTALVISAAATLAPKLRIPAPLILVLAGIVVSLIPGVPSFVIDPHIILLGMLPALLYASASSIPAMNFRREFRAINGLSIVLILLTSLALGRLFTWLIPGLPFGWGVALGAILSPTDAVATSMIKGRGVPNRVTVMLEGEGLLNDATALIALRTAVVATSLGFSFLPAIGDFALSVVVAIAMGILAGFINLAIRRHVKDVAVNTILSFTTPYIAAAPTELLHGSGLVAAVVAGFIIGARAPRVLPPMHRVSDARNWATIELGLEGLIFLTMGLQLSTIVKQVADDPTGIQRGVFIAVLALALSLVVRAAYVFPLLHGLNRRATRLHARKPKIAAMQSELEAGRIPDPIAKRAARRGKEIGDGMLERLIANGRRHLADLDYLAGQPLHAAETTIIIWAGMRGAVTVAAAQLLPETTPHRSLLVFIAFAASAVSLLVQGGTIGFLAKRLFPTSETGDVVHARHAERGRIQVLMENVGARVERGDGMDGKGHRLAVLTAQRHALLDARDDGIFGAEALVLALRDVDIDEMVLDLRTGAADGL